MTETTDIKALRPSELAKLGFVTDDNTGGYYVAECEECGQIFPSQNAEGGGPIADSGDYDDCYCPHCGHVDPEECDNASLVWNVQQLKIITLTSQLEEERQRADEMRVGLESEISHSNRCIAKINTLEAGLTALRGEILSAKQEINWPIAHKVRAALDRAACPDAFMRIAVEACTDALHGDQEPVGLIKRKTPLLSDGAFRYSFISDVNLPLDTELFTRQPKPVVVLPKSHYVAGCADMFMSEREVRSAMQTAGIVVKDGEQETKPARTSVIGCYENSSGGLSHIVTLAEHRGVGICLACQVKHPPGLPCPSMKVMSGIEIKGGE